MVFLQKPTEDKPDRAISEEPGKEPKKRHKKKRKKLEAARRRLQALTHIQQPSFQPQPQTRYQKDVYDILAEQETRQIVPPAPQLGAEQIVPPFNGHQVPRPLPTNQVLPMNSTPFQAPTPHPPPGAFDAQSAWRRAGMVSHIVAQPAIARRKQTLEIADVANPDNEAEVYESSFV